MSRSTIELNGIALEVHDPRRYLEVLFHAVETIPFYSPGLRNAVLEALGDRPPTDRGIERGTVAQVLGFVDQELIAVLDREWQDYEHNEADRLFEYLSFHRLFGSIKSVLLVGAGACRLADYVASLEFVDQVVCSDLSWPALNFGRALLEADYAKLPELVTRRRVFYHVEPKSIRLTRTERECRFKPPLTPPDRRARVRYVVRDAFATPEEPTTADLIAVPYLLDLFRGPQCINLLLRICRRLRAGQQILILVTCIADGKAGPGRDPGLIMDALHECGFKVQFLDLIFLPYSFSYYSYGQMHTDWNTLVVRAERTVERDGRRRDRQAGTCVHP